jgi:hypothetical protein
MRLTSFGFAPDDQSPWNWLPENQLAGKPETPEETKRNVFVSGPTETGDEAFKIIDIEP